MARFSSQPIAAKPAVTKLPPAKVYVVDDDDAVRDSLSALIDSHGFDVEVFTSGKDFLTRISPNARGCLLLDLHLPVLGGLEILKEMRAKGLSLPVILITGGGKDRGLVARAGNAGATFVMEKPLDYKVLLSRISDALKTK